MLNRHLSRSIVLQTLFEWDFRKESETKIPNILDYNLKEFAIVSEGNSFAQSLIEGILKERENLDNIIQQAAPQWPLEKISVVDRNILRIGIFELLFSDKQEVPPKVAINEAIELAKAFGGENSGKFVSGVLGTIYKELGEPRKYETAESKKNQKKEIDTENLPTQELGGAVIYTEKDGKIFLAFVHNVFGYWTLVKGTKEEGESLEECVVREVKEETGLEAVIENKLDVNEYVATLYEEDNSKGKDGGTPTKRSVTYFLAKAKFEILQLEENGGERGTLDDVKWFELSKVEEIETYDDLKPILNKGVEMIKSIYNG